MKRQTRREGEEMFPFLSRRRLCTIVEIGYLYPVATYMYRSNLSNPKTRFASKTKVYQKEMEKAS